MTDNIGVFVPKYITSVPMDLNYIPLYKVLCHDEEFPYYDTYIFFPDQNVIYNTSCHEWGIFKNSGRAIMEHDGYIFTDLFPKGIYFTEREFSDLSKNIPVGSISDVFKKVGEYYRLTKINKILNR